MANIQPSVTTAADELPPQLLPPRNPNAPPAAWVSTVPSHTHPDQGVLPPPLPIVSSSGPAAKRAKLSGGRRVDTAGPSDSQGEASGSRNPQDSSRPQPKPKASGGREASDRPGSRGRREGPQKTLGKGKSAASHAIVVPKSGGGERVRQSRAAAEAPLLPPTLDSRSGMQSAAAESMEGREQSGALPPPPPDPSGGRTPDAQKGGKPGSVEGATFLCLPQPHPSPGPEPPLAADPWGAAGSDLLKSPPEAGPETGTGGAILAIHQEPVAVETVLPPGFGGGRSLPAGEVSEAATPAEGAATAGDGGGQDLGLGRGASEDRSTSGKVLVEFQTTTVPALRLPSTISMSAADRASFRSCPHDKNSPGPADRLDHIQMLQ